jgi:tyrosyl-tRNA synthetase
MTIKNLENYIDDLLTRGVGELVDPDDSFKNKLFAKARGEYTKDIYIKFGVDPTRPDIHVGHAVILRKLRKFQDLGCKVIFLIGDFTAHIGDPTGKSKVRPELDQKEIEENMKTYLEQVDKILLQDQSVFSWIRNSDWFTSVTDIEVAGNQSVNLNIKQGDQEINLGFPATSFVGKAAILKELECR